MTDITVVILQKNEALHIRRCLERLVALEPQKIYVVDCYSTDGSDKIASEMGAKVEYHDWPGNQAAQFNWALDNLQFETGWILRLDADEYLESDTIEEIKRSLPTLDDAVTTLSMKRICTFLGQRVRFGVGTVEIIRLFRRGCARYGASIMDEHLVSRCGRNYMLRGYFVDDNLNDIDWWTTKHLNYAEREARMVIAGAVNANKRFYYKLPPYIRAVAYWFLRYVLRGGFLDGRAGFRWHFFQGLWYRCMVDWKIETIFSKRSEEFSS